MKLSVWPIYMSLGNHTSDARDLPAGKRLIGFIGVPEKRSTDSEAGYRECLRTLYLQYWVSIFRLIVARQDGILLRLRGNSHGDLEVVRVLPRVGVFLGDLLETRMVCATNASFAVRCQTRVMVKEMVRGPGGTMRQMRGPPDAQLKRILAPGGDSEV